MVTPVCPVRYNCACRCARGGIEIDVNMRQLENSNSRQLALLQNVMPKTQLQSSPMRLARVVIGITLLIFAGTLTVVTLQLREKIRTQIANRDAELINNIAAGLSLQPTTMTHDPAWPDLMLSSEQGVPDPDLGIPLGPADSDLEAILQLERLREITSRLRGLLANNAVGIRLFDADGRPILAFGHLTKSTTLDARHFQTLRQFHPVSLYKPAVDRDQLVDRESPGPPFPGKLPLLEVLIPMRSLDGTRLVGIAQVFLDGTPIQKEFAALDSRLVGLGSVIFLIGGAAVTGALTLAFRRLDRMNRELADRTARLVKANTELARSARAAAVGAITAHLLHGLKNPVAGLQEYLHGLSQATNGSNDALDEATRITRRMQSMILEISRVLR
ncbi:MAG: hypothetical protein N3G20_06155, partial [Verrucomicrobiae bacterium]|nr:hypothetical protein [Verrucomicrobiae bacterium]